MSGSLLVSRSQTLFFSSRPKMAQNVWLCQKMGSECLTESQQQFQSQLLKCKKSLEKMLEKQIRP